MGARRWSWSATRPCLCSLGQVAAGDAPSDGAGTIQLEAVLVSRDTRRVIGQHDVIVQVLPDFIMNK
jgi:hypothetical protein